MRKNRSRLIALTILLVILFFGLMIKNNLPRLLPKQPPAVFPQLKKEAVLRMVITDDGKIINLYKKNGDWFLKKEADEFKADEEMINQIINGLASFRKGEIVSNNKNRYKDFGIGGKKISLTAESKNYVLFVGETAGENLIYLRVDSQNEVFLGEGFVDIFNQQDFRDLNVNLINNENNLNQIEINFGNNKTNLTKKGNHWYLSNNLEAKKDRVDFFINDLKTLKGNDVLSEPQIQRPSLIKTVFIRVKEGSTEKTADFFPKDEENYYIKTSSSSFIFQIPAVSVASFKKEAKDFTD